MEVRASRDPRCHEMNWAIEHLSQGMGLLMRGTSLLDGSVPPLEMASVIMPGKEPVPAN